MTAVEARAAAAWHRDEAARERARAGRATIHRSPRVAAQMHDRAAVALDVFADGIDAEARGRAEGYLSGMFASWCRAPECACGDHWTAREIHSPECAAWVRDDIELLAAEASRDE